MLDSEGHVYTCGKGNFGRLGHGSCESINQMTRIDGFMKIKVRIRDVEAGGRHCLAISEEDPEMNTARELFGWGFNFYH